jgi:hypothetical protein
MFGNIRNFVFIAGVVDSGDKLLGIRCLNLETLS